MIDIVEDTITQNYKTEKIKRLEVWYVTPFGMTPNREEAIKRFEGSDLDPNTCTAHVIMAISENLQELINK